MPAFARILFLAAMVAFVPAPHGALAADPFVTFVTALRPDALAAGVSAATFDAAFAGLVADPKVIAAAKVQPEFRQTIHVYVDGRVTPARVTQGRALAQQWRPWLDRIEKKYGVDRYVVLAIWGLETNYGPAGGNSDTIRSLATLACCTQRRPELFRAELIAALQILEAHDIAPRAMTGSWAGALGQTQFMPSSFLKYAVDMDGDGHRDIWRSVPDALASIADYLQQHDWDAMKRWGYEVRLPANFDFAAITAHEGQPVAAWEKLGIVAADGKPIAERGAAWLFLPAGAKGPAFLTLQNFWAIKTYNISDSYTLSIGLLADRLRGGGPLVGAWPAKEVALGRADLEALQRKLAALGHAIDKVDGKVGPSTRAALRAWQADNGILADGYPTPEMLTRLGVKGQ